MGSTLVLRTALSVSAMSWMIGVAGAALAEPEVQDPARCPAVFGEPEDHAAHRASREDLVELVELDGGELVLLQGGDWGEPTPLRFSGVDVVAVHPEVQTAILNVDLEGVCQGTYRVAPDLEIGPHTRIIAMLEDAVVVDHEGALRVLSTGDIPVDVEAVWRSSWTISTRTVPRAGVAPVAPAAKGRTR